MPHCTRSARRNHHGGHHAPSDPLGVYMPSLSKWPFLPSPVKGRRPHARVWRHPNLDMMFMVWSLDPNTTSSTAAQPAAGRVTSASVTAEYGETIYFVEGRNIKDAYAQMRQWYASLTPRDLAHANPDWSALRAKASHVASRARHHAGRAYDYAAPKARAAGHAAWEGAKATGRAMKRGAKRAAPHVARGARAAADRMEKWAAQPNPRIALGDVVGIMNVDGMPYGVESYYRRGIGRWGTVVRGTKRYIDHDTMWPVRLRDGDLVYVPERALKREQDFSEMHRMTFGVLADKNEASVAERNAGIERSRLPRRARRN